MTPDYAAAAAEVHPAARMDAAIGMIAHRVGAPTTVGETLRLLTACARFADDPKAFGIADRLTASLTQRAFPLPHPEAMMAAVYGAGQAVAALDAAKRTVERLDGRSPVSIFDQDDGRPVYIVLDKDRNTGRVGITMIDNEPCVFHVRELALEALAELREDGCEAVIVTEADIQAALDDAWRRSPHRAPPHPEAMMAAVYGAGQAVADLDAAKRTVERLEAEPPSQTTAEILRGWAADADEAMQGPLLALAQHAEQELATAGQSVAADAAREAERSALEVIAERLSAIDTGDHPEAPIVIEPETFAILACLTRLEASVKYGVQTMREALEIKDTVGAQAHEWKTKAEAYEKALFDARRAAESLRLALHGGLEAAS